MSGRFCRIFGIRTVVYIFESVETLTVLFVTARGGARH